MSGIGKDQGDCQQAGTGALVVTQADRDAAAGLALRWGGDGRAMLAGEQDSNAIVQAFALHRIAAQVELVSAIQKVRAGYASQMKFCDVEPLGYYREFVRRLDDALAKTEVQP